MDAGAVVVQLVVVVVVPDGTLFKVEAVVVAVTNATVGCIVGFVNVAAVVVTTEDPVVVGCAVVVVAVIRFAVDENKTSDFVIGSC